jgi:hypothetical protein
VLVLEADAAGQALGGVRQQRALATDALEAVDLLLGALDVAEVGDEVAPLRSDDADPVRAGEAREVAEVHHAGDDERVEPALGETLGEAVGAAHDWSSFRSISSPRR